MIRVCNDKKHKFIKGFGIAISRNNTTRFRWPDSGKVQIAVRDIIAKEKCSVKPEIVDPWDGRYDTIFTRKDGICPF